MSVPKSLTFNTSLMTDREFVKEYNESAKFVHVNDDLMDLLESLEQEVIDRGVLHLVSLV